MKILLLYWNRQYGCRYSCIHCQTYTYVSACLLCNTSGKIKKSANNVLSRSVLTHRSVIPFRKYECDDIEFLTAQSWEWIRSLLHDLGYIDEVIRVLKVRISKLRVLPLLLKGKHKLNLSNTRLKWEKNHYVMCLGTPIYSASTKEITAGKGTLCLFIYNIWWS